MKKIQQAVYFFLEKRLPFYPKEVLLCYSLYATLHAADCNAVFFTNRLIGFRKLNKLIISNMRNYNAKLFQYTKSFERAITAIAFMPSKAV